MFNQKKNQKLNWLMEEVNAAAQDTTDDCGILSEIVDQILLENDLKFQLNFLRWYNLHSEIGIEYDG